MKTLVLNAGYEPMSIVSFRRAIILVLAGKATVLAADSCVQVRSETLSLEQPSVILLTRYVRPPSGASVTLSRRGVLRRDDATCAYCRGHANTVDHVLPRSRGGGNTWQNLVACCRSCNNEKGDRTPEEMGWSLPFTPGPPRTGRFWLRELDNPAEQWRPFLSYATAA
ncbi:HNH endonuclease [Brevibacterium luteolum]|uniref:HNH endonuclease n=1 Tax=Brevibacterium luteolum TaxID=199591 RepID=A0A849ATU3_9MICO|nr:5-methylcytosine-specific restriction endonuclease McrA [Brevibacterium luteolum]MCT1658323.1 HNH endonuclease [Brevibacterium luteolum]NNG79531.1 HNH endonuclease [Brevibacterium luteolum]